MSPLLVELDIFSGRPNPTWRLSPGEAGELLEKLRALGPGSRPRMGLGYRGFVIHRADSRGHMVPWLRIGLAAVSVLTGSTQRSYRDTEGIESWLKEKAVQQGFGPLIRSAAPTGQGLTDEKEDKP